MGRRRNDHPKVSLAHVPGLNELSAAHRLAGNGQWARAFLDEIATPPLALVMHVYGDTIVYVAKCKCKPVCDVRMKALEYASCVSQSATVVELSAAK